MTYSINIADNENTKDTKIPPLSSSEDSGKFDYDDRPAELDELNFSEDVHTPSFREITPEDMIDNEIETRSDEIYSEQQFDTDTSVAGFDPTDDELTPETLIHEDGARSPNEPGGNVPADQILSTRHEDEIGEGYGLDEAELARVKPLDGKPWDGPAH
jgi:hypothetical protein